MGTQHDNPQRKIFLNNWAANHDMIRFYYTGLYMVSVIWIFLVLFHAHQISLILGAMDWRLTLSIFIAICVVISVSTELSNLERTTAVSSNALNISNSKNYLDSEEISKIKIDTWDNFLMFVSHYLKFVFHFLIVLSVCFMHCLILRSVYYCLWFLCSQFWHAVCFFLV